ncbi:MAG: hypothetical protein CMH11_13000 [Maritimibacter sp.]|nr:hypothetical protein [Maritimibacter sp.]|tara:strand:+ start:21833 stop:23437 length:1605 start_codon:yes stop_codon:yes gene_type:complete
MSLKSYANATVAVCIVCAVLFAGATILLYSLVERVDGQIKAYERQSDPSVIALTDVVGDLGFGGMIHSFKNYLLRGGDEMRVFDRNTGAILTNLEKLERQLGPTYGGEIDAIRSMVREYEAQSEVVRDIRQLDSDIEGIDDVVRVDDTQAAVAMVALTTGVIEGGPETKWTTLFALRSALGYDGMIHQFKNFVLRKTPGYEAAARASADRALLAIDQYRGFPITPAEDVALADLAEAVATFRANIDVARDMIDAGAGAAEIDTAVLVPKESALSAFATLGQEIQRQTHAELVGLHQQMDLLKLGAVALAVLLCAGVAIFSLGLRWTIQRVAVAPAAAIAEGLGRLAEGETHVDLSAYANDTEIGQIARASRRFREALVDNIRKSEDLRGLNAERDDMLQEKSLMVAERADIASRLNDIAHWRNLREEELRRMHDDAEVVIAGIERGSFSLRLDDAYKDEALALLARDLNRILDEVEKSLIELHAPETGPADPVAPADAAQAATLLRRSMAHALDTLNEAIDEVRREADGLKRGT